MRPPPDIAGCPPLEREWNTSARVMRRMMQWTAAGLLLAGLIGIILFLLGLEREGTLVWAFIVAWPFLGLTTILPELAGRRVRRALENCKNSSLYVDLLTIPGIPRPLYFYYARAAALPFEVEWIKIVTLNSVLVSLMPSIYALIFNTMLKISEIFAILFISFISMFIATFMIPWVLGYVFLRVSLTSASGVGRWADKLTLIHIPLDVQKQLRENTDLDELWTTPAGEQIPTKIIWSMRTLFLWIGGGIALFGVSALILLTWAFVLDSIY